MKRLLDSKKNYCRPSRWIPVLIYRAALFETGDIQPWHFRPYGMILGVYHVVLAFTKEGALCFSTARLLW